MWAFLTTNPLGWAILATTAIAGTALVVKKYNDSLEEAKQKIRETAEEAKSAIKTITSDFDELSSTTDSIKQRYAQLAQEVENLGKANQSRGSLSNDEYAEFLDLSNQLAELFPQLTVNYDENGNAILGLSGNVNTIVGSLNDLVSVQQELANKEIMGKMSDMWSGYMLDIAEYKKDLSDMEKMSEAAIEAISQIGDKKTLSIVSDPTDDNDLNGIIVKAVKKLGYNQSEMQDVHIETFGSGRSTRFGKTIVDWDFSSLDEVQFEQLKDKIAELGKEYEDAVGLMKSKIDSANSNMASYINTWLSSGAGEWNFNKLNSNMQNVVKDVLINSDWLSSIPDEVDAGDWDEVSINVGGINISCPGVTSREVMREVGIALDNKFRGLHNYANQYSRI